MEDLTKHQLILIVLLISFVTSIATGIITFTLLQEAPVEVTQTINRVVEKTIERVVPAEGEPEKVITTVVVSEEDRILEAVAKNEKSIVRLKTTGADGSEVIAGLGLVISADGTLVADLRSYNAASAYTVSFFDGKTYSSREIFVDSSRSLVFMKVDVPQNENPKYTFYPAVFGDSSGLKIGQTIVAISGRDSNAASIGRIFQLQSNVEGAMEVIISNIKVSRSHPGSPILNLSGEVVGLEAPIAEAQTEYSYLPINIVKTATAEALQALPE